MSKKWVRRQIAFYPLEYYLELNDENKTFTSAYEVAKYACHISNTPEGLRDMLEKEASLTRNKIYEKFEYRYVCEEEWTEEGMIENRSIRMYGLRRETDKEYARRIKREEAKQAKEKKQAEKKREQEYKNYLALKKKFEDKK